MNDMTPLQELLALARARWEKEKKAWRTARKRLRRRYLAKAPWWALPGLYKSVWRRLRPDVKGALGRFGRFRAHTRLVDQVQQLGQCFPDLYKWTSNRHFNVTSMVFMKVRIQRNMTDVEPILRALLSWGWEVNKIRDSNTGREWVLKHPGEEFQPDIHLKASTYGAEECEIVEREVEQPPKTEYEIVCPGEEELVGEVPA